eukprot:gene26078-11782_t
MLRRITSCLGNGRVKEEVDGLTKEEVYGITKEDVVPRTTSATQVTLASSEVGSQPVAASAVATSIHLDASSPSHQSPGHSRSLKTVTATVGKASSGGHSNKNMSDNTRNNIEDSKDTDDGPFNLGSSLVLNSYVGSGTPNKSTGSKSGPRRSQSVLESGLIHPSLGKACRGPTRSKTVTEISEFFCDLDEGDKKDSSHGSSVKDDADEDPAPWVPGAHAGQPPPEGIAAWMPVGIPKIDSYPDPPSTWQPASVLRHFTGTEQSNARESVSTKLDGMHIAPMLATVTEMQQPSHMGAMDHGVAAISSMIAAMPNTVTLLIREGEYKYSVKMVLCQNNESVGYYGAIQQNVRGSFASPEHNTHHATAGTRLMKHCFLLEPNVHQHMVMSVACNRVWKGTICVPPPRTMDQPPPVPQVRPRPLTADTIMARTAPGPATMSTADWVKKHAVLSSPSVTPSSSMGPTTLGMIPTSQAAYGKSSSFNVIISKTPDVWQYAVPEENTGVEPM